MDTWLDARFEGWPDSEGVAMGRDRLSGASAALKVARTLGAVRALERERVASAIAHPGLRQRLDEGRLGSARALALAWITGTALGETTTAAPLRAITIDVLRALLRLHAEGRVHGDLKPEHVLVGAAGARLFDLGLSVRLGEPPAGGTRPYLAPEYERGGVASVAGDLYALGVMLAGRTGGDAQLEELALRARSSAPEERPASAEAALAILGARPRAIDRRALDLAALERWTAGLLASARPGAIVRVHAPAGSGASTLAGCLLRAAVGARAARVAPECVREAVEVGRAYGEAVLFVVDGAVESDADLLRAPRACWIVLADEPDAPHVLPPLDDDAIERLARENGRAVSASERARLREACAGRAGRIARVLARLADDERLGIEDALARELGAKDETATAESLLAVGTPRAAVELLLARTPGLEAAGDPATRRVLALALEGAGELARAADVWAALDTVAPLPELDLLAYARVLERCGRGEALLALGARSVEDEALRAELRAMVAFAHFTRGRLAEARAIAEEAAASAERLGATGVRLLCIASDAALRAGDERAALTHAERARDRARALGEARATAQALSRIAGVHAMAGRWLAARGPYAEALAEAERVGDRTALSPYLMNVAVAEHALFEVEAAIGHYERAIALARELGRAPSEAAALTNLAALLELVGAHAEAEPLLVRAEEVASAASAAMSLAQARMIHAEVARGRGDLARARELAAEARSAFETLGVARQALEASLLEAELALDAGEARPASAFLAERRDAARQAGLHGRVVLLEARAAEARDDAASALRALASALDDPELTRDRETTLRVLVALARAHARAGTGAEAAVELRARELRGTLAMLVPAGLRERFLARHALPERAPAETPRLEGVARAMASLLRRTLRSSDETLVLEAAVDEAIALTRAERAFLLARRPGRPVVTVARNLDRETIKNSRFRFSRSVAERVLATGEPLVTASASDDPELAGARSILDLGVRSIVCVPIRGRGSEVLHALYLDHRFERARFSEADLEVVEALADVIGLCLENARLFAAAEAREKQLVESEAALRADVEARALEVERLSASLAAREDDARRSGIVGTSRALLAAVALARRVAPSTLSVLVEGESGTGKELFAKLVHAESPRRARPMLSLNCGALPEALLESELFGHVRGAFTGATRDQPGLFRAADGGTLFLDEIGEMPLAMQARLLRVLADGEVRPVGSTRGTKVDVRIVAATNRDLAAEVARGTFREDLFFRLAGVRITLPPLRERREDLPALATSILERLGEPRRLAPDALRALLAHPLPGNVRELEQALRRASIVADGDAIHAWDLALAGAPRTQRAKEPTRAEVEAALAEHGENRVHAASALGVHRTTLHRLIQKHGIESAARRGRPRARR
ncbi:MAG: sigma 54-interacting transcriptional regulator [Sandaracinus sp.]